MDCEEANIFGLLRTGNAYVRMRWRHHTVAQEICEVDIWSHQFMTLGWKEFSDCGEVCCNNRTPFVLHGWDGSTNGIMATMAAEGFFPLETNFEGKLNWYESTFHYNQELLWAWKAHARVCRFEIAK